MRSVPLPTSTTRGPEEMALCEPASGRSPNARGLELGLAAPKTVRNKRLFINHPVCGICHSSQDELKQSLSPFHPRAQHITGAGEQVWNEGREEHTNRTPLTPALPWGKGHTASQEPFGPWRAGSPASVLVTTTEGSMETSPRHAVATVPSSSPSPPMMFHRMPTVCPRH